MNDKDRGVYNKYIVERVDGRHHKGEKHEGCKYFVLDLDHDPHAKAAMLAYADSCQAEYPLLAHDCRMLACQIPDPPPAKEPQDQSPSMLETKIHLLWEFVRGVVGLENLNLARNIWIPSTTPEGVDKHQLYEVIRSAKRFHSDLGYWSDEFHRLTTGLSIQTSSAHHRGRTLLHTLKQCEQLQGDFQKANEELEKARGAHKSLLALFEESQKTLEENLDIQLELAKELGEAKNKIAVGDQALAAANVLAEVAEKERDKDLAEMRRFQSMVIDLTHKADNSIHTQVELLKDVGDRILHLSMLGFSTYCVAYNSGVADAAVCVRRRESALEDCTAPVKQPSAPTHDGPK